MKRFLFTVIMILCFFSLSAQDTVVFKAKHIKLFSLYPGYIIKKNGDTLKGYIMLKNYISNQDKVWFYKTKDTPKKEAVKFKPKDILAYKVGPRYYESHKFWPNVPTYVTNNARGYHFVLKVIDGPISMYKWYYEDISTSEGRIHGDFDNPATISVDLSFSENDLPYVPLVKKENDKIIFLKGGIRKTLQALVSDYPELANKIKHKAPGYKSKQDLENIVNEYNLWYEQNYK